MKINALKTAYPFLLLVIFNLFSLYSKPQTKPTKYSDFDHGYYYFYYDKLDSAFLMFNRYVNAPDDSLKKGQAYCIMGDIQWKIGDLYGAQESLTSAIKTLNPQNKIHRKDIGHTYNLLGNVSLELKLYDEAIDFYNQALTILKGTDYGLEILNGKAVVFQKMRDYKEAIAIYDSMLAFNPADQRLVARLIDNRARTKWLQDSSYPALSEFQIALKIRADSQYNDGLVTSYAHISDYYAKSNADSALWYAKKMFEKATAIQNPDDALEAIDKLIRLNKAPAVKEHWYDKFTKLKDSLQLSRDTTRNRFALIRYDVQKNKADNLALQQHISKQRLYLYGVLLLAALIITGLSVRQSKRRKRIKQEAENAIRDSKLKTSQKVHDVVANGLYGVMNELEHIETIERESLINKIEVLYEKSRDISYEDTSTNFNSIDFKKQVHNLLQSFANDKNRVFIVGNEQSFWIRITINQKSQLQLVLNEIMINMKKHSQAKKIAIGFKLESSNAIVTYKDDGVGFPFNHELGNGLKNTVSRIKSINGEINFDKSDSGGASITISFPLHP